MVKHVISLICLSVLSVGFQARADNEPPRPTLTLTPAVVSATLQPGQAWTQSLRMSNFTGGKFRFDVEVQDVVVRNGVRTYAPAGELESSIAATAVVTPRSLEILPQEQGSVTVTLTVPRETRLRAVVIYFRGRLEKPEDDGTVGLGASLGALITFQLSNEFALKAGPFSTTPQTEAANQVISHQLTNEGPEVIVPRGATVILDASGRSVAKATFPTQRFLPGESLTVSATSPIQLKTGHYRAVSSFEFNSRVFTADGEFSVP
jgi:hypothetical protein